MVVGVGLCWPLLPFPFFFFSFFFFGLVEYCVGTSVRVRACRFTINDQYDEAVESFGPSAVCFLPEWLL